MIFMKVTIDVPQWPELVGLRDIDDPTKIAGYVWWQPPDETVDLSDYTREVTFTHDIEPI